VGDPIYAGSAWAEVPTHRGWLLGHFRDLDDARHSRDVEIKWAVHPKGDERAEWVEAETRSAVLLLISGRFRVELPGRSVVLAEQGDYVVVCGVSHSWFAEEDSVVVAVRWPSVPGYSAPDDLSTAGSAELDDELPAPWSA
jgi:mannose-6-phosphate isomerase-like protein (cupin superfamily)